MLIDLVKSVVFVTRKHVIVDYRIKVHVLSFFTSLVIACLPVRAL